MSSVLSEEDEADAAADGPNLWLVEDDAAEASSTGARWAPLRPSDSRRLERAWRESPSSIVPVYSGRYDVDLPRRTVRAIYWEEPERRVLRSSWFFGAGSDRTPYEEEDSENLEAAFRRLREKRERAPLSVRVNHGSQNVRFEVLPPPPEPEDNALLSFLMGGGPEKQRPRPSATPAAAGPAAVEGNGLDGSPRSSVGRTAAASPTRWTAVQEPADRKREEAPVPVWRGHPLLQSGGLEAAAEADDEVWLPEAPECLVFVVHGIGQYHRAQHGAFYREVDKMRRLSAKCQRRRLQDGLPVRGRIEFLPLEWFEPIHVEVGIGNRLRHVTLPSVPALRDFANFGFADFMVYLDETWRERIHRELRKRMDRLYGLLRKRVPEYPGKVSVIGHSLGGVIMFDLLQPGLRGFEEGLLATGPNSSQAESVDGTAPFPAAEASCPSPRCFFAIGSPLGMFLSIRLSHETERSARLFRGLDVRWPPDAVGCGWRFFNVFHPDDPIAYRIEPLLNQDYKDAPPRVVLHEGGLRFHHQVRGWWQRALGSPASKAKAGGGGSQAQEAAPRPAGSASTLADVLLVETSGDDEGPSAGATGTHLLEGARQDDQSRRPGVVAVDRLDWALQEGVLESMNELLSAIHSHFAYWQCEDLVQFITDQVIDALDAQPRAYLPPGS